MIDDVSKSDKIVVEKSTVPVKTVNIVDKQVAADVKAAFVRLSTCACIGDQEFKQILKKISQHPDLDVKLHR
ncbi:putative UDP-glucose 6-dehydrogenase [Helianthus annuus]|nr:putative UDP-glucose 6-dehydrogenase [Helianthus annuus]